VHGKSDNNNNSSINNNVRSHWGMAKKIINLGSLRSLFVGPDWSDAGAANAAIFQLDDRVVDNNFAVDVRS